MLFGEADTRAKVIDPARRNYGSSRHEAMRYDADVKFYTFEIVIEKEEEDARKSIREAIQQHVASLLAHGQPVPQHEKLVHVEELTVGIP
jgi:predicted RNase H-like HicB family nuclease